jgi:membrane associated rhomboid family serine protease
MLLPIGDDNIGRRTTPVVVYTIVALNVIVFLLFQHAGLDESGERFMYGYSAVPYEITNNVDLVQPVLLRDVGPIPQAPGPSPIWLTILTSMFMHGGWMHIIGNLLYLWIFGDNIEDNFGHGKFLLFYLIAGVAASAAQIAVDPNSPIPTLGASGAIAGVLGSYLIMFPRNRVRALLPLGFLWTTVELPALVVLGFWIVIQIFSQYTAFASSSMGKGGGVAYMAHIGGFVAGVVLTFLFRRRTKDYARDDDNYYRR